MGATKNVLILKIIQVQGAYTTHMRETSHAWHNMYNVLFTFLELIFLSLFVASTVVDLVEVTKTTTVVTGNITQTLNVK